MPGVGGLMAVHAEALELQLLASGSDASRRRFQHLRRLLFVADAAHRGRHRRARGRGRACQRRADAAADRRARGRLAGRRLPLRAVRPRGPARVGERRRRGAPARAHLPAVSWPLFGLLVALSAERPAAGAFFGALACAAVAGISRSGARIGRAPRPAAAPAHADRRLGRRRRAASRSASSATPSSGSSSPATSTTTTRSPGRARPPLPRHAERAAATWSRSAASTA